MKDPRVEKWRRWFEQGITDDIYTMHLERFAWKRMEEIVNGNPALKGTESYLWEFLFNTYAKNQAMAPAPGGYRRAGREPRPADPRGRGDARPPDARLVAGSVERGRPGPLLAASRRGRLGGAVRGPGWRTISILRSQHYQVLDDSGGLALATKDIAGDNPQALVVIDAPREAGDYTLRLWLSDAEGNVGAPAEVPLSYDCPRSAASGGQSLSAGIGEKLEAVKTVHQGQGSIAGGSLHGAGGAVEEAAVCVFARVTTDGGAEFIGTAITSADGSYKFPVAPGPSREIIARYRDGHREIEDHATVLTQIEPTLRLRRKVVHNRHKAIFYGDIPGPHNDDVVVVLQVKDGKG